jgi:hypothetical protein
MAVIFLGPETRPVMGTQLFSRYIITVSSLLTIVSNDHLQFSACNDETETTQLFKHEEWLQFLYGARNSYNVTVMQFFEGGTSNENGLTVIFLKKEVMETM